MLMIMMMISIMIRIMMIRIMMMNYQLFPVINILQQLWHRIRMTLLLVAIPRGHKEWMKHPIQRTTWSQIIRSR